MAPPWILLERTVRFMPGEATVTSGTTTSKIEAGSTSYGGEQPAAIPHPRRIATTCKERAMEMAVKLQAMKPYLQASEPPEVSHLSMVQQAAVGLCGGRISCTDKSIIVLYAGNYRPGYGSNPSSGCYQVYDASDSSICAIPQLPDRHTFRGLGAGVAILSMTNGSYILAELVGARSKFPNAELFLWLSPSENQEGHWIRRAVQLPPEVFTPGYFFNIDMVFTYVNSHVCWVDLLKGVLVYNLMD